MYNLSVTRELLKQVYIAERLQPPTSLSTIRSAYSTLWARASNPAYWREIAQSGELARVGVYAVEAYGIFKVRTVLEVFLTHFHLTNFFWFWFPALDWGDRWTKESCWVQLALGCFDFFTVADFLATLVGHILKKQLDMRRA